MAEKVTSPDSLKARILLDELWSSILDDEVIVIDKKIDKLINSQFVAIRYCLPTQLLGKFTNNDLNCLCLQKGDGKDKSLWDPRSLASKVIVPWVSENHNILGTSTDPYVGKPLRKKYIDAFPNNVKGRDEWAMMYEILFEVEKKSTVEFSRIRLQQTLKSIHNKFKDLVFEYNIPERISLEQTLKLVENFLSENSGGDRGLSVSAAIFETFSKFLGLYSKIKRSVINASDQSTGLAGDIECVDDKEIVKLAIEVKERNITITDLKSSILKARKISLKELLFNAPGFNPPDEGAISETITKSWASGTNIYNLTIQELIKVGLTLTGESSRRYFIERIGFQLDTYNTQPSNRKRWKELLDEI